MGQCLSGNIDETDAAGLNYHHQEPLNDNGVTTEQDKLERSPAGLKDFSPSPDNYKVNAYINGVLEIFDHANKLRNDFETVIDKYCQKMPTSNDQMTFKNTYVNFTGTFYEFFRASIYKLDEHVQHRKNIALKALHGARRFKAEVDKQFTSPKPNFNLCRDLGLQVYVDVDELYDHFYETFRYAPKQRRASLISIALKDNAARGGGQNESN